ncbi:MAG: hypothetical protein O6850_01090, partial [Acidobacteria bacterium]|nr:hypothetical protein [Acidobacteriota bacterium]
MRRSTLFCSLGEILFVTFVILATAGGNAAGAEMARLAESTWDDYVPKGKEVDSIYGDYVLRNKLLTAVIADPIRGRNANMTTPEVGCSLIDLTVLHPQSDQLSAFYPGGLEFPYTLKSSSLGEEETTRSASVELACSSPAAEGRPEAEVTYTLRDGEPYLRVTSVYRNTTSTPLTLSLEDIVRADRTFETPPDGPVPFFWAYD